MIELVCRSCGAPFIPTRQNLLLGPDFSRDCPFCRAAIIGSPAPSPTEPPAPGPRVCPQCKKVLKSGHHRHGTCPGRSRRGGRSHDRLVARAHDPKRDPGAGG